MDQRLRRDHGLDPVAPVRRRPLPVAVVSAARPRQWIKNLLVFAAPAAAAVVGRPSVAVGRTAVAAALFCVASSGVYLLNDAFDAEADKAHPLKRLRPVAAGEMTESLASVLGMLALVLAVAAAGLLSSPALALVVGIYAVISVAYSAWLKHVPVLELACVSSGFVLRAIAGGVAARVPLSPWFLVVACAGSLFVALGKRTAEFGQLGALRTDHRSALGWYRLAWLHNARRLSGAATIAAYCLWAITRSGSLPDRAEDGVFILLSMAPFALGVLAVEWAFAGGRGGAPEDLALHDRLVQAVGVIWATFLVLALTL